MGPNRQSPPGHSPFSIAFRDVCYDLPVKKWNIFREEKHPAQILSNVSGHVLPGESLAILGPSGAGKSTLLNLLAARTPNPPSNGKILFAGRPRTPRTKRYIGYVMQDDVFFSKLTVRQTLSFSADIRLPHSMTQVQRKERVDAVILKLGLEKCQNTIVGDAIDRGISGGERKRLNIASELIHEPSLFLADECTSGLDSSSALNVLNVLEGLCKEERTVIVTIHQPSSRMFVMFSKILLLASGRVAYFGPPNKVVAYFESIDFPFPSSAYNPAEHALDLLMNTDSLHGNPSIQTLILDSWTNHEKVIHSAVFATDVNDRGDSSEGKGSVKIAVENDKETSQKQVIASEKLPPTNYFARFTRALSKRMRVGSNNEDSEASKYTAGFWQQTIALMRRTVRQKQGLLLQTPPIVQLIMLVILTIAFWFRVPPEEGRIEDRLGLLAFFTVSWGFYSVLASLFTFPPERTVLQKDRANGAYRLSCYYIAKSLVELPADTLYPLFSSLIIYYPTGMNPDIRAYVLFNIIIVLNCLCGHSIGLLVCAIFMDFKEAQLVGSIWVLFSLMVSGYLLDPANIPKFVLFSRDLSFIRYAYESTVRLEFMFGRTYNCEETDELKTIYSGNGEFCPVDMRAVLAGAALENSLPIWAGILVQIAWIVILRLLGYFALKLLHTTHKPKLSSWKSI